MEKVYIQCASVKYDAILALINSIVSDDFYFTYADTDINDIQNVIQVYLAELEEVVEGNIVALYSTISNRYYVFIVGPTMGYELTEITGV